MTHTGDRIVTNPVSRAFAQCRPHLIGVALFSAVGNVLLLTPSIYMMQVYDRVIPTGGLATLAAISLVGVFALLTMTLFDWLRSRLLVRIGVQLDRELAGPTLRLILSRPALRQSQRAEAMRHLDSLRHGVSSAAVMALFDAPWSPVYIIVAFLLHPALGALALLASLTMVGLAWHNERRTAAPTRLASEAANAAYTKQQLMSAHAAEVRALGMAHALADRQLEDRAEVNRLQAHAAFTGANHQALIKFFRLTLQSGSLALGAVLVVEGSVSGGAVFASSLLLSRALQPVEQLVASWRSLLASRIAYARLNDLFVGEVERTHTLLPPPAGAITADRLTVANPSDGRVALADASFAVEPGDIVGVVGPSGAGKSTLLRTIAGGSTMMRGALRIDGAAIDDWDPRQLSRHIGYLPQNFILFPGSVKDNISRFQAGWGDRAQVDADVVTAAQAIGAHDMILRLAEGYDTIIGPGGTGLSAGQTQRIAIARALFGAPRILLLDEPTAHLDAEAKHLFVKTLATLRQRGATVLFSTHDTDVLAAASKVMLLRDGRVERLGALAEPKTSTVPVSHSVAKAN